VRVLLLRLVLAALLATILPLLAMRWVPPLTTSFMVQRFVSSVFQGEPGVRYRWVAWRNIPRPMRLAVVAAEDQKFPDHWGFDFQSIADAAERNNRRRVPRGASTITQQVAKNLFLWPGRSWLRKGIEAYLTVWIELLWPKRRILEVYLNIAEFGDRTYGVGAASEHLMRKPPRRLTTRDASLLAAVLPNPRRFRADRPSPYVERRAAWIQKQMRRLGSAYLDDL
jgi:monofunctional biosynthetic peptidoglycan transglycosylase